MAAPDGIVWGSTVGGYGRIGIYVNKTQTNDKVSGTIDIWFWSKYSVSDTSNTLYYDNLSSSGSATTSRGAKSISTTVDSGSGWSTSNQKKLTSQSYTFSYDRGTSASTRYLYASLKDVDRVGGTMYASTTISVPALPSYAITYNANGGSGAPGNQTKYYGKSLTLSSDTKPTRSGYTFVGWGTSASDTSKDYDPGDTYTANAKKELFAIWSKKITLTYNVNGGSGTINSQSATVYNATTSYKFTLSSTKPTKTGHSFLGWSTSNSATTASYSAGGTITLSTNTTLYAVWKANTYTITYNANGGSGAPGSQTKTYGKTLTLSTTKPTKTNYNFLGWATTSSATTPQYQSGGSYTANSAATLYAVWELAYVNPTIYGMAVSRCDENGNLTDSGAFALVKYSWKTTYNVSSMRIEWSSLSGGSGSTPVIPSGTTSATETVKIGSNLSMDVTYSIKITVEDSNGSFTATKPLPGVVLPIDAVRDETGNVGVAFGGPAEQTGVADFKLDAQFNKPVYGNALGLNRLPTIPDGTNVNTYINTGCWAVYTNASAQTMTNLPLNVAGRFIVYDPTGTGGGDSGYTYIRQRYEAYTIGNGVWERQLTRDGSNEWSIGAWICVGGGTAWATLNIASGFAMYGTNTENQPMYRVNGPLVTVKGVVTPSGASIAANTTGKFVYQGLPAVCRPKINQIFVCQGSSINRWTLTVDTEGSLSVSRYGSTEYIAIPEGAWLPFNATYSI